MTTTTTLMRENEASDEVKRTYVDMMNTVMDRMDHVIFEILDYSRNSRLEVVAEKMDIVNLVKGAVNTYRHFSSKPVLLKVEENIQSEFYADSRRIQSVLNNLISNAIKYSLKGPQDIQLRVSVHVNADALEMVISDNGEGIREEVISSHVWNARESFLKLVE
jgi:signal transduction histidine kinase